MFAATEAKNPVVCNSSAEGKLKSVLGWPFVVTKQTCAEKTPAMAQDWQDVQEALVNYHGPQFIHILCKI